MNAMLVSFILGLGAGTYLYAYLARHNGNSNPKGNMVIAGIAGFLIFLFFISLTKFVLNLK